MTDVRERVARAIAKSVSPTGKWEDWWSASQAQFLNQADAVLSELGWRKMVEALEHCETFFDGWWMSDEEMQSEADGCKKAVVSALSARLPSPPKAEDGK